MEDYTEEDLEKLLEKEKPPFTIYLKAFFLLFVVGGGMLFVNFMAKNGPQPQGEKKPSQTLESILGTTDQLIPRDTVSKLKDRVESQDIGQALQSITHDVQGEAAKATDKAMEKTKESAVDYIYDNTIVKVIENMIEKLPQLQREKFIKTLQKRYPESP